jgi:hypothetical protein
MEPRQKPENPDKFRAMMTVFAAADTKEELRKLSLMYIFDESYPRGDICLALHEIEVERGWH